MRAYPKGYALADAAAKALGNIGHKQSLPVLERAAEHGVQRAIEAVAAVGNTQSFETMLTALQGNPERCAYIDFALYWLVRRSNQKTEAWMTESSTTQAIQIATGQTPTPTTDLSIGRTVVFDQDIDRQDASLLFRTPIGTQFAFTARQAKSRTRNTRSSSPPVDIASTTTPALRHAASTR